MNKSGKPGITVILPKEIATKQVSIIMSGAPLELLRKYSSNKPLRRRQSPRRPKRGRAKG